MGECKSLHRAQCAAQPFAAFWGPSKRHHSKVLVSKKPHWLQGCANKGDDVARASAGAQDGHLLQELRLLFRRLVDQPLDGHGHQPIAPFDDDSIRALAQLYLLPFLIQLNLCSE